MGIRSVGVNELAVVRAIIYETINEIYSHYYPQGAVDFFLAHHSEDNILADIKLGGIFMIDINGIVVGTVTIKENEISRLFVSPQYQGKGYGRALLDFAEEKIFKQSDKICLDASLPAKTIYLKRGYKEIDSHSIITKNGDFLCYDVMEKGKIIRESGINYEGKVFIPKINSENGEVNNQTIFYYHQNGCVLWADYSGGDIIKGHLIGTVLADGILDFYYHHINKNKQVKIGRCHSIPVVLEDGKLELREEWQWLNGDKSMGVSVVAER